MLKRQWLLTLFLALAVSGVAAQTGRTVKLVVPFAAGGSVDILGRVLAEQITKSTGTATVVENRPGGGTLIAQEQVLRSTPDGNTILLNANSFVINPSLRKLSFDPLKDFEPICYLVSSPQVIVVNASSAYRTLAELIAAAKARPGELSLATVGPGTAQHIAGEMFKRAAQVDLIYVAYPGGAPAVTALLGGHVATVLANYSEVAEQLKAGTVRALATTSAKRIDPLPDLPTVQEAGYKDFVADVWFGAVAPGKTPKDKTAELARWLTDAMSAPDVKAKLVGLAMYPVGACGDAFATHLRKSYDDYARIIRDANIKAE
jgi:tripartite-type tricarboxylate transporter receptor subunit TctC